MNVKTSPATGSGTGNSARPTGPVLPPRVAARRRRPGLMALSVALIAAGGLGGAVLLMSSGQRTDVVTVVRHVPVGQPVTDEDLGTASLALDKSVKAVRASRRAEVVGQRAAVELVPGSLLSASQVTDRPLVLAGEQVVPVGLKPEQVPASVLAPGQRVRVVAVPGADQQGKVPEGQQPKVIGARVVKVGEPAPVTGVVVVDVAASGVDAPVLAAWVSSGNVRLVLDGPEGGA
ncbi:SAF domain-containing protein [Streptomyces sp. ET3-23]|uniref:SAF domain-containing protein n=1 Tax=Streptomyces sp. ET3-23 TaxID=2885643 RepID=UPI001D105330|nr:SAF domain-containing protein [Streptomyces sp. ET3-23]MCC2280849.1 SAF domain-containing protein [Streptomyces sp. ET3-23]